MDRNQAFIHNVKMEEVPWQRLTTAYGRATDLPKFLDDLFYSFWYYSYQELLECNPKLKKLRKYEKAYKLQSLMD